MGSVRVEPLLELMADWRSFLEEDITKEEMECFRFHERTGRPLGDETFLIEDREAGLPSSAEEKTGTEKERYE